MKKVTAVMIGAGGRGAHAYAPYALNHSNELQFVAVAEPNKNRRESFQRAHNINDDMCFSSWGELLKKPKLADAVFICTLDEHFDCAIKAMERRYNILLEKPMSHDPDECYLLGEYTEKYDKVFAICHVLRYTRFFSAIKRILEEGRIGRLISIQHNENVGFWHHAHSYVRGSWAKTKEGAPMLLSKSCHDLDILTWLAGADCVKLSSFGTLTHFREENVPEGAPKMCLDGCPAENQCPYYAPRIYFSEETGWLAEALSDDASREARMKALAEERFGRCVYRCNNDVVDHQVVNIEFANEVTAAFTMCGFTKDMSRTIKLMGTNGQIRGDMEKGEIEITDFCTNDTDVIRLNVSKAGHCGGDQGIVHNFVRMVQEGGVAESLTSAKISVQSHLMAFAAEKARLENKVVIFKDYIDELKRVR